MKPLSAVEVRIWSLFVTLGAAAGCGEGGAWSALADDADDGPVSSTNDDGDDYDYECGDYDNDARDGHRPRCTPCDVFPDCNGYGDGDGDGDGDPIEFLPPCGAGAVLDAIPLPVEVPGLALTFVDGAAYDELVVVGPDRLVVMDADTQVPTAEVDLEWSTMKPLVRAARVDGDDRLDLVVADPGPEGAIQVLLRRAGGAFEAGPSIPTAAQPVDVAVLDFDGDGANDLFAGTELYLADGLGGFAYDQAIENRGPLVGFWFPGQARDELLVADGYQVWRYDHEAGRAPLPVDWLPDTVATGLERIRLDDDEVADLVRVSSSDAHTYLTTWLHYLSNWYGPRTFDLGPAFAATRLAVGDFNGNGDEDVLILGEGKGLLVLDLAEHDGLACQTSIELPFAATAVAVGNATGDARSELALSNAAQTRLYRFGP